MSIISLNTNGVLTDGIELKASLSLMGNQYWYNSEDESGDISWDWDYFLHDLARGWKALHDTDCAKELLNCDSIDDFLDTDIAKLYPVNSKQYYDEEVKRFNFWYTHNLAEYMHGIQVPFLMLVRTSSKHCTIIDDSVIMYEVLFDDVMQDLKNIGNTLCNIYANSEVKEVHSVVELWKSARS